MKDKDGIDLRELTPNTFKKVLDWGRDKGIVDGPGSDPTKQLAKTVEELGEVASALLKNDTEAFHDGIGDVMVCLTILAGQRGADAFQCFQDAYNVIKDRTGVTKDGVFIKSEDLPGS
jgi:NTP pyrophosphatase (non-canonical NTP hydrolase)